MKLVKDVQDLLSEAPSIAPILGLSKFDTFAELAGTLFTGLCNNTDVGNTVARVYGADASLVELTTYDVTETARRNFEPGGPPATLLFSRGVHAVMAHRIANYLWTHENPNLALAFKTACGRVLDTDIHPAAQFGAGLWLDHGLGFVVGETCVIDEDVSIWHNVTLGSTLSDSGACRHPYIGRGAVIGAGAVLLGNIKIGANANIGAGAIVVEDVADNQLVVGNKAAARGEAKISFLNTEKTE